MILPNPDKLNRFNKYALVMLAAKRARHLQEQGIARRALIKSASNNPLTIALEEVAAGRLIPAFQTEPLAELKEAEQHESYSGGAEAQRTSSLLSMLNTNNGEATNPN